MVGIRKVRHVLFKMESFNSGLCWASGKMWHVRENTHEIWHHNFPLTKEFCFIVSVLFSLLPQSCRQMCALFLAFGAHYSWGGWITAICLSFIWWLEGWNGSCVKERLVSTQEDQRLKNFTVNPGLLWNVPGTLWRQGCTLWNRSVLPESIQWWH